MDDYPDFVPKNSLVTPNYWFKVRRDSKIHGPFTVNECRQLYKIGRLNPLNWVSRNGEQFNRMYHYCECVPFEPELVPKPYRSVE